jgi:HSP20 family protein
MARWEREMERMFDDFFERRLSPFRGGRWWPMRSSGFSVPAVDLYEDKGEVVAKVELPGLDKDEIEVNITDHLLTIRGEKKHEEEIREDNFYRAERSRGSFSRSVDLPEEVDTERARASFKNGLLEIRMPKTEEAKQKGKRVNVE